MSSINFLGSYSGIDQSTVDQLMEVEKMPLVQMSQQKIEYESEQGAWKDINTRLDSLMTRLKELKYSAAYMTKTATSSDSSVVSGSASSDALDGSYQIQVTRLATTTRVIGEDILAVDQDNSSEMNIEGTFTLGNNDGDSVEITVALTDSLSSISDLINNESETTGIESTIIDGRIVLQDSVTGGRSIGLSDSDGTTLESLGLGLGKTTDTGNTALFSVNGISIERDSNTVTDAVEGLSLTLSSETAVGEYETLTVGVDTDNTVDKVQDFVDQYNSTLAFMQDANDVGDVEADISGAGALAGDPTLQRMVSNLRTYVTGSVSGLDSSIVDLSQLGIKTEDRSGQLVFDSSDLVEALEVDPENVKNFFYNTDAEGDAIGFEAKLESYLNSLIADSTGIVEVKRDGIQRTLDDLEKSIESFSDRMETREQYYINMFAKLDVAMQQAESQMSWLTSQLSGLSSQSE
jgi:flagellar hook-associated protein 2